MALQRLAVCAVLLSAVSGALGSSDAAAGAAAFGSQNVPGWLDKIDNPLVQTAFLGAKTMAENIQLAQSTGSTVTPAQEYKFQPDGVGPGGAAMVPSGAPNTTKVVSTVPVKAYPPKRTVPANMDSLHAPAPLVANTSARNAVLDTQSEQAVVMPAVHSPWLLRPRMHACTLHACVRPHSTWQQLVGTGQ